MELKIATDQDQQKWDEIVERSPNGELFHTWKWLKLMEEYSIQKIGGFKSKARLYPVFLMEKDAIVGIYPLYIFQLPLINLCFCPPANVDTLYLGPLFPDFDNMIPSKKQSFLEEVQVIMDRFIKKDLKADYIQINTPPGFEDCRFFKWGGYVSEARYTSYLDLSGGTDLIWKNLNRNLRRSIEKVKNAGVLITEGDKDDIIFIHNLLKDRSRITSSDAFLGSVYDAFSQDNIKIWVAKAGEERLSGIIMIIYKDKMAFWIGAPKCSYNGTYPNELLVWEIIRWAGEHGFRTFEIVGADDYSLFPFKRKFNAKTVLYFQSKWFSPTLHTLSALYRAFSKKDMNLLELETR